MSNSRGNFIRSFVLCGAAVFLSIIAGSSPAWSQIDITAATLPHVADSVIWDWYHHYDPANVSNDILGLYGASWHSGDERTGQPFPHWVQIDFGTARVVTQLNILAYSETFDTNLRLNEFRFEGSNDGITFTPLHQGLLQYANRHEWQSFLFENPIGYRFYRLYGLNNWIDYREQMIIEEWEMFESAPKSLEVAMIPHNPPVAIPTTGGEFFYDVTIENTTDSAITADVGIQAVLPNGSLYTVQFLRNINFPAATTIVRNGLSQWVPAGAPAGIYTYRLSVGHVGVEVIDSDELTFEKLGATMAPYGEADWELNGWDEGNRMAEKMPMAFALSNAVPNPFNPMTTISFDLPKQTAVTLRIYDVSGRLVRTLLDGQTVDQGRCEAIWNGRDDTGMQAAAGVYFYRLEAGEFRETKRAVLIK